MLGNTNLPAVGMSSEPFIRTTTGGGSRYGGDTGSNRMLGKSSGWVHIAAANNSLNGSRTKMTSLGPQLKPSLAQLA